MWSLVTSLKMICILNCAVLQNFQPNPCLSIPSTAVVKCRVCSVHASITCLNFSNMFFFLLTWKDLTNSFFASRYAGLCHDGPACLLESKTSQTKQIHISFALPLQALWLMSKCAMLSKHLTCCQGLGLHLLPLTTIIDVRWYGAFRPVHHVSVGSHQFSALADKCVLKKCNVGMIDIDSKKMAQLDSLLNKILALARSSRMQILFQQFSLVRFLEYSIHCSRIQTWWLPVYWDGYQCLRMLFPAAMKRLLWEQAAATAYANCSLM